jgi:hypothetical protein
MPFTHLDIEFTKDGAVHEESQLDAILHRVTEFTDLFVVSHGWNNDRNEAGTLYTQLFSSVDQVLASNVVQGLSGRRFGVVCVFWPSKKFANKDLIPGGGAASATTENDDSLSTLLEALACDPVRLGGHDTDPVRNQAVRRAQELIPALDSDRSARHEFVLQLRSLLNPSEAHDDDGSAEFFTLDPQEIFAAMEAPVLAPGAVSDGGTAAFGAAGGAAGLADLLSGARAAARRIANFVTYYQMKERAGTVGRTGVQQMLRRIRDREADIRLHLIGHSFGGRLVTAAAHGLPPNTPAVTLMLLQAAYSHNGLAEKFDGRKDGFFRKLLSQKRASGPVVITHTKNDQAVGIAYPLASRLAGQKAAALGDEKDPYGGMGRNGAQHTREATGTASDLRNVGGPYNFTPGKVYNLKADHFIKDHGDVTGHQVAYALLMTAKSV